MALFLHEHFISSKIRFPSEQPLTQPNLARTQSLRFSANSRACYESEIFTLIRAEFSGSNPQITTAILRRKKMVEKLFSGKIGVRRDRLRLAC